MKRFLLLGNLLLLTLLSAAQDQETPSDDLIIKQGPAINGFVRGGFYAWKDKGDPQVNFPAIFSDLGLKINAGNGRNLKAYTDLRFRYGTEFNEPVSTFDLREAYIQLNAGKWDISFGRQIIKWGRGDFTNPVSRFSPVNMISRSPDREDMDMGNILSSVKWHPVNAVSLEVLATPLHRSSRLIIDPFPLPDYVIIDQSKSVISGKGIFSYGLRASFHLRGIDWSLSWFDGYDPMPGIRLDYFVFDPSQPLSMPVIGLELKPYRNRVAGIDFETAAGPFGIRGEVAWAQPSLSFREYEYVPLPELKWVAGMDWMPGRWTITAEYCGKYIDNFTPSDAQPIFGTEVDPLRMLQLLSTPGFDMPAYIRQQVAAFNRLYNYQADRYSHYATLRVEADLAYGRLLPSVTGMFNWTTGDLLLIPEMKYKPLDGMTLTAGAELYSGREASLYDLVNDFMNGFYVSLRFDF